MLLTHTILESSSTRAVLLISSPATFRIGWWIVFMITNSKDMNLYILEQWRFAETMYLQLI